MQQKSYAWNIGVSGCSVFFVFFGVANWRHHSVDAHHSPTCTHVQVIRHMSRLVR